MSLEFSYTGFRLTSKRSTDKVEVLRVSDRDGGRSVGSILNPTERTERGRCSEGEQSVGDSRHLEWRKYRETMVGEVVRTGRGEYT